MLSSIQHLTTEEFVPFNQRHGVTVKATKNQPGTTIEDAPAHQDAQPAVFLSSLSACFDSPITLIFLTILRHPHATSLSRASAFGVFLILLTTQSFCSTRTYDNPPVIGTGNRRTTLQSRAYNFFLFGSTGPAVPNPYGMKL
ncbi:HAL protein kinase [Colletotrichum truncatum]|uniref:HAL protein kinase n=1 Tax=Colletotrichum truncatum TaxID=5467 RepID=A0ACC3YGA3_COLTU|nr:HAL protein kinase [Colletotrichum truncatum]KAF6785481.1 HAL protein kinase [Colletotrichum truncatum]